MKQITVHALSVRPFEAGTSGWTCDDLNDPRIERLWDAGRYEIIEGTLTRLPSARYDGSRRLRRLTHIVERHLLQAGRTEVFVFEVDLILSPIRVPVADAILMTEADEQRQREENARRGQPQYEFGRILVPPTVIIESLSDGHERKDLVLKRQWYAEAAIPNFWIFDPLARSLQCLVLDNRSYREDQSGTLDAVLHPVAFPGLVLRLSEVWK